MKRFIILGMTIGLLVFTSCATAASKVEPPAVEEEAVVIEPEEEPVVVIEERLEEELVVVIEELPEDASNEIDAFIDEHNIADTTVEAVSEGILISIYNIQFEPDSTTLTAPEIKKIVEISGILRNYRGSRIQVAGHSAVAGSVQGQMTVSQERARTIARYLVMLGACRAEDVTAVGYGAERPIASNDTAEGMTLNRRVEITILEK